MERLNVTLEVEISENPGISIQELEKYIQKHYGKQWRFNRTEPRYDSCVIAIFEEV